MRILVTGGSGFIGAALVKRLVADGHQVRVLDNNFRGSKEALAGVDCDIIEGDITDYGAVFTACAGCNEVIHLAYINGTKLFYEMPDEVLRVATRGMLTLLDACKWTHVSHFMLASSSEVCRAVVGGMDEGTPLVIPDPHNPRYSYSAGKIISEMLLIHSGLFDWYTIFRPFNVYGPGMSEGHVIPDFKLQLDDLRGKYDLIPFTIQGSGQETRSFCYIDDAIDAITLIHDHGAHKGIYNIGTEEEITIESLATRMAMIYGCKLKVLEHNALREGSIQRRKPDIKKLTQLGYRPKVSLDEGLRRVLCQ